MMTRIPFQTQARAGAVTLLEQFRDDTNARLQIFPTWPRSINPPTAFVDEINESLVAFTKSAFQRTVSVEVIVLFGIYAAQDQRFNAGDAIAQRDEFVDSWVAWVADNFHGFGANTSVEPRAITDIKGYAADWLPPTEQKSYVAVRITLEGFAAT
jgi:hypothetical protein